MTTPSTTEVRPSVGIIGARGLLGASLADALSRDFAVTRIDRASYDGLRGKNFDVLVNANGNSRRFWANANPSADFAASTASVLDSLFDFSFDRYVYFSSSDVYPDHGSPDSTHEGQSIDDAKLCPYGFHKCLSERIVRRYAARHWIFRLCALLGQRLSKGPIFDLLQGRSLFVTPDTSLQFISTAEVANVLARAINESWESDTINLGGKGAVSIGSLIEQFRLQATISPDAGRQRYEMSVERLERRMSLRSSQAYAADFLSGQLQTSQRRQGVG